MGRLPRGSARVRLALEVLEARITPSTYDDLFTPVIVAGDDLGAPADAPIARVDANTTSSYFSGVGSVQVTSRRGTFIGTGTVLTDSHSNYSYILTAAHVVDINNDGKFNSKDGVTQIKFWFNFGGNQTQSLTVSGSAMYSSVFVNPNYTGFNRPSVNDDLAIVRFVGSPPAGSKSYSIYSGALDSRVITMVGYGRSGYGDVGYTVGPSWSVKRVGQNVVDAYYGQDDSGQTAAKEVFRFDFDGPTSSTNYFGGFTLGNNIETTLGGGDSGGPSFIWIDGTPYLAGVNTFTQSLFGGASAPLFGSLGGGIVVGAYVPWLTSIVPGLGNAAAGTLGDSPAGIPGTGDQVVLAVPPDTSLDPSGLTDVPRIIIIRSFRVTTVLPATVPAQRGAEMTTQVGAATRAFSSTRQRDTVVWSAWQLELTEEELEEIGRQMTQSPAFPEPRPVPPPPAEHEVIPRSMESPPPSETPHASEPESDPGDEPASALRPATSFDVFELPTIVDDSRESLAMLASLALVANGACNWGARYETEERRRVEWPV